MHRNSASPTVSALVQLMREKTAETDQSYPYGESTTRLLLKSMGFNFKAAQRRNNAAEAPRVVTWRTKYIMEIRKYRALGYQDLYLDETWYDTHTAQIKQWTDDTDNCAVNVPSAKGDRILILHCGGRDGFVPDALLVTHKKMTDAPADYHGSMNADMFEKWFLDFLNNLESPSVIVMDNASYHSRLAKRKPTTRWTVPQLKQYVADNDLPMPQKPTQKALLAVIKDHPSVTEPTHVIDDMALAAGHVVCRLPPYNCVLNPIELVWSEMKRKVASQNLKKQSVQQVRDLITSALSGVGPEKWRNYISHVEKVEQKYVDLNDVLEGPRFLIDVGGSSDEDSDIEY